MAFKAKRGRPRKVDVESELARFVFMGIRACVTCGWKNCPFYNEDEVCRKELEVLGKVDEMAFEQLREFPVKELAKDLLRISTRLRIESSIRKLGLQTSLRLADLMMKFITATKGQIVPSRKALWKALSEDFKRGETSGE